MGFSRRKLGEHAAMKALREQLVHGEPFPRPGADDDGQIRFRRMRLRSRERRLDANVGFFSCLGKRCEPRQQQFIGEERRHVQPDDAAAVAHLQLLRDRLEFREDVADVLEVVSARIGQRQGAHAAARTTRLPAAPRGP